jgi:Tfp pilus assembly protein PilF
LARYEEALAAAPERLDIRLNRGTSLLELDRIDEAISIFDGVLAREPGNLGALINRGNACIRAKRMAEALANFDRALAIDPDHTGALIDRGVALAEMGRYQEALACHDHALRIEPDLVAAHVNRGNALVMLARLTEAISSYDKAITLDAENAEANFNAAVTRLCVGEYAQGWKQYEHRWKKKYLAPHQRQFPQPMWRGEGDLSGKTILLHAEQGFGDTLSAVRYVPLVAALGAKVVLGVQPALKALMVSVPGVAMVLADGEPLPAFDLHCPLMSLPLAFKTELATVPLNIPYLRAHPQRITTWRERLPENGRPRVGLCWAGNPDQANDRNRSMPLERLIRAVYVPGLDFVSLQKYVSLAERAMLREHGVARLGQEFKDFSDTAAVISMLDLVVTVDTSVAHLAGARGKAVAVLVCFSPDFRLMLERTDCPWYPTMRLFRQTAIGDWHDPVERLCGELVRVGQRAVKPRPPAWSKA